MKNLTLLLLVILLVVSLGVCILLSVGIYTTEHKPPASTSIFSGEELFFMMCGTCHSLDRVTSRAENPERWALIVKDMQRKHPDFISDAEAAAILEYLNTELGRGR